MTELWQPHLGRLTNKHVLVLAAFPRMREGETRSPTSPVLETEEAVMSLVRAIVSEGGHVTLIGDTSLALLAGVVGAEYITPQVEDSRDFQPAVTLVVPEDDEESEPLDRLASLRLVGARREDSRSALLERARTAAALVCVGDNSPDDVQMFLLRSQSRSLVFSIAATGVGAATLPELNDRVIAADRKIEGLAPLPRNEFESLVAELEGETPLPPVALAAQWIVEQLIERRSENVRSR